jgi:hypothetical protein
MARQKITFTDRELGVISLALVKCDAASDLGHLPKPWCDDHDDEETLWLLTKLERLREEC